MKMKALAVVVFALSAAFAQAVTLKSGETPGFPIYFLH